MDIIFFAGSSESPDHVYRNFKFGRLRASNQMLHVVGDPWPDRVNMNRLEALESEQPSAAMESKNVN